MNNWDKLNDNQKFKNLKNGKILVIVPNNFETTTIPLFCKVCEFPMKTKEDGLSFRKYGCCEKCDNKWTNYPGVNWEEDKVPNKNSEDWIDYYNERLILSRPIINVK